MSIDAVLLLLAEINVVWLFAPAICLSYLLVSLFSLDRYGLVPRRAGGLIGIVSMPFIHGNARHLWSNVAPLIVLCALLVVLRGEQTANLVCLIQMLGGALLWFVGRTANHIGASLLVFGLVGFHLTNGLLSGNIAVLVIATLVAMLYGSQLVRGVLPWRKGTSWDGHLCGFIAGAGLSYSGFTMA